MTAPPEPPLEEVTADVEFEFDVDTLVNLREERWTPDSSKRLVAGRPTRCQAAQVPTVDRFWATVERVVSYRPYPRPHNDPLMYAKMMRLFQADRESFDGYE